VTDDTAQSQHSGDKRSTVRQAPRVALAGFGLSLTAAGAVATFRSTGGAGSAALVIGGIASVIIAVVFDRLESLSFGGLELKLARQLEFRALEAEMRGDVGVALTLRGEVDRLLGLVRPAAQQYEQVRESEPPGRDRTMRLYDLVNEAHEFGRVHKPSATDVRRIFDEGGGQRVFALVLMADEPALGDTESVLDAISHSRSAFEQYQALETAISMLATMSDVERSRLAESLRNQMNGGWITRGTDRRRLAETLLEHLEDRRSK
jgi:hypothetical protein